MEKEINSYNVWLAFPVLHKNKADIELRTSNSKSFTHSFSLPSSIHLSTDQLTYINSYYQTLTEHWLCTRPVVPNVMPIWNTWWSFKNIDASLPANLDVMT